MFTAKNGEVMASVCITKCFAKHGVELVKQKPTEHSNPNYLHFLLKGKEKDCKLAIEDLAAEKLIETGKDEFKGIYSAEEKSYYFKARKIGNKWQFVPYGECFDMTLALTLGDTERIAREYPHTIKFDNFEEILSELKAKMGPDDLFVYDPEYTEWHGTKYLEKTTKSDRKVFVFDDAEEKLVNFKCKVYSNRENRIMMDDLDEILL